MSSEEVVHATRSVLDTRGNTHSYCQVALVVTEMFSEAPRGAEYRLARWNRKMVLLSFTHASKQEMPM